MTCGGTADQRPAFRTRFFDPSTKCCTYLPTFPNFLVGRILADTSPAAAQGRLTTETRLNAGVGVTPLGIGVTPVFDVLYAVGAASHFGRSRALRCPHYLEDLGTCGVWQHREAVCTTFFCKFLRGAVGLRFWRTLRQLLSTVERELSVWCALKVGMESEAARRFLDAPLKPQMEAGDLDGVVDVDRRRRIWGSWFARERQMFLQCAELVERLHWADVQAICGPRVTALARLSEEAFAALESRRIPGPLKVGPYRTLEVFAESSIVESYRRQMRSNSRTR